MLIIKAFVNEKKIDEIYIQNVESFADDLYRYCIRKPEIEHPPLLHRRKDGWRKLAIKALYILEKGDR